MPTIFEDERFQDLLLTLIVKDRQFLKECHSIIAPSDFVSSNGTNAKQVIAKIALGHFEKYREPISDLLSAEVADHCRLKHLEGKRFRTLTEAANTILDARPKAVESIITKVVEFKRSRMKAAAVEEMIDLHNRGQLTDEKWLEISHHAIDVLKQDAYHISDYFAELSKRISRRKHDKDNRFPVLFIDPLDSMVRAIARGHIGLLIAPYKRGKSMGLIHIAGAYTLQKLNVLYITLEDPLEDVEDRFDAWIAQLPIKKLTTMPKTLRLRFRNFVRLTRARLKIYDVGERSLSVPEIESIWEDERSKGFVADAVIVDYDDEIKPSKRYPERRLEFADIYRSLRRFSAKKNLFLWTAAQTRKGTHEVKIITGDHLAEDVSKIRKVSFALGLGKGDWGDESLYLNVAAHKFDREHIGCHIVSDKDRMLIYSREKTYKAARKPRSDESAVEI